MKSHPNFDKNVVSFQADLPVKEIYMPPLNIMVYDNRKFGAKPLAGSISLKSLKELTSFLLSFLFIFHFDPPLHYLFKLSLTRFAV